MPNNFTALQNGFYIVRTQAGFNQAVKDFSSQEIADAIKRLRGFPQSYPSFIALSYEYYGYHYIQCRAIHLRKLEAAIEQSDLFGQTASLNESDCANHNTSDKIPL